MPAITLEHVVQDILAAAAMLQEYGHPLEDDTFEYVRQLTNDLYEVVSCLTEHDSHNNN